MFSSRGDGSIILIFAIIIGIFLAGIFMSVDTTNPVEGILQNSQGKVVSNSSLQIDPLNFISVTPAPTPTQSVPTPASGSSLGSGPSDTPTNQPTGGGGTTANASMLCGTNLGLFNGSDSFLTSAVQNVAKQQLHVGTIRMPIRGATPNNIEIQAAQAIHALGIAPLVILHMGSDATTTANNKQIISQMNSIFGNSIVYYELGNEMDLHGYSSPASYTTTWNQEISQLKPLATHAWFGGPVNFQQNPTYIAYFVKNAATNVQPDFISWHEYSCGPSDSAQTCYDHVGTTAGHNWTVHIQNTKSAIQANGNTVPPIFITEWNYDASQGSTLDPRLVQLNNLQFAKQAITVLKNDGVYAAYQYVLNTNQDYNLVNGSSLTPEGQSFGATCAGM